MKREMCVVKASVLKITTVSKERIRAYLSAVASAKSDSRSLAVKVSEIRAAGSQR
jgi:hypothetical protein